MWIFLTCLQNDTTYFGAIVGRVANRIGGASFKLNGVEYRLPANDHGNTLHGMFFNLEAAYEHLI